MSVLVTSPGVSALGQELVGTQLVEELPATTDLVSVPVYSLEDFEADGGYAVIDRGTTAEEWVTYAGLDASSNTLDDIVRLDPRDHLAGAWVQPATASSTLVPDVESPSVWTVVGAPPQPVLNPVTVDPPDPDPAVIDPPDLAPVGADPPPVDVAGPDPAPVGADAPPLHSDGVDPAPVFADPDPVTVGGTDPAPLFADPDPIAVDGYDPGPVGFDAPPTPPLEIAVVRDPVCTPPVTIGGSWVESIRSTAEGLFQKSQTTPSALASDSGSYLMEWATYIESSSAPSDAWALIYQLDEVLAELQRQGVATSDPVFAALAQLLSTLLGDVAVTSTAAVGEVGDFPVPELCLATTEIIRNPDVDAPPIEFDPDPVPGVYRDPDPVGIDAAPLPAVVQDPQPIDVDPDPVGSIDYDPDPVELDVMKLPDVREDLAAVFIDPVDIGEQKIDPPDPGPATDVDAAEYTESLIGGAGLPVGAKVWGNVPIIDIPVSEPDPPRSAFTAQSAAAGPGEGAWSCYYYETTSVNGGFIEGEAPDTNYAVDTSLGAHTYNRAYNQAYDLSRNTSSSWAAAGHEGTYNNNKGRTRRGAVIIPWKVAGRFDLGISCTTDGVCGQAEANTNVEIVLRDVTDGAALARRPVPAFEAEGDTVASYQDTGEEKIEFTYQPGHTYKALIKITGYSSTDIPFPGLSARATNDAFNGQYRAYMEYVQWQFYGNARMNCG